MATPLQRQLIHVPFAGGMHQKTDQRWLEVGNQANVTNGIWVKQDQIQKRPGITALSKLDLNSVIANNLTVGTKVYTRKNEYGVCDGQYIRAYSPGVGRFKQIDEISPVTATRESVAHTSYATYDSDLCEGGGYRVHVWSDAPGGGNSFWCITDTSTGSTVSTNTFAFSGQRFKLLSIGTRAIVVYTSGTNIMCRTLDLTASGIPLGWSAALTLSTLLASSSSQFEITRITNNANLWALVYEGAGGNHIVLTTYNSNPTVVQASTTMAGEVSTGFTAFAMRGDSSDGLLWIMYGTAANGVKCAIHNPTNLTQITAPFVVQAAGTNFNYTLGLERIVNGRVCAVMGGPGNGGGGVFITGYAFRWTVLDSSGSLFITPNTQYGHLPVSKPFAVASQDSLFGVRIYMLVVNTYANAVVTPQITQTLVELGIRTDTVGAQCAHPVATIAPRFSFSLVNSFTNVRSGGTLSNVTNLGVTNATTYVTTGTTADSLSVTGFTAGFQGRNGLIDITFDFAHPGRYTSATLGESTYFACGVPSVYDGKVWAEFGSLASYDSNAVVATALVAGGNLAASQTYSWVFVPEWYDANGQRHQGQPSLPITATTGATNKKVLINAPQIHMTTKADIYIRQDSNTFIIVPYRTAYVGGAMSTVFYRTIGTNPGALNTGVQQYNESFTYTDDGTGTLADSSIVNAETLYITGGVLESDAPPSFTTLCSHKNRIYGIGDDQTTVYISTEYVPGQIVRFNDLLTFSVADIGPLVACWSMDDKLFFASKTKIVYFSGSGPNELGQNSDLSGPYKIASDVGCVDPRSVVVTQSGTFFQSAIGISLLDRSLSIASNVGDDIEDVLAANPFVTSAFRHPSRPEVWFTLATATGAGITGGTCISYNYRFGTWSQHLYYDVDQTRVNAGFVSAGVSSGVVLFLTPYGQLYTENTNLTAGAAFYDGPSRWVTTSITTPWIKPAGLQGFARMWNAMLGVEWNDGADITVYVATNYAAIANDLTAVTQLHTFPASAVSAVAGQIAQMEIRLVQQKAESYQFIIFDATPTGISPSTGRGVFFTGLTVEVGVKDRPYRLPAGRRA